MKTKRAFLGGVLFSLTIVALVLMQQRFGILRIHAADKAALRTAPSIVLNTNALPKDTRGITSFAPVVKRVAPSVVTIYSSKTVRRSQGGSPLDDPIFRRFFGPPEQDEDTPAPSPRGRGGRRLPQREQKEQSLGSGVIISTDGYILSNNHVVEGADEVKVSLNGSDEEFIAKVVGADPQTDVSVLKVDAKNLPPITMTDSDNLQVGDLVLAVGNPFGVGQTVTMGIVSATGRGKFGIVDYEDFIQTDAAINMGNSGGALVDAEGRLVGINTAIISPSGGSIGLGFAVPINMVRRVMDSIISEGKVTRGYLGIRFAPEITAGLARKFGLKDRSGALVDEVMPNSPAAKASIQAGDVITELDGRKVPDGRQFRLWVSQTAPNSKITFKVFREGKEQKLSATLGELQMDQLTGRPNSRSAPAQKKSDALDGVEVADLDRATRRQAGIPPAIVGALVTSVDPNSTAAEAGLRDGDVILEIDRQKVKNAQEAIDHSEKIKDGAEILLRVWSAGRDGTATTRFLMVEPSKPAKGNRENR
ncbi:MAG TPA: DegQ family serine endoprotease [Verrucomicrobiae bacterium]|jgi:serine protease Do